MTFSALFLGTPLPLAIFGDIGGSEVLLVLGAILVLFGGKGLPEMARKVGKMSQDLQRASAEFKKQLLTADQELEKEVAPLVTEYESLTSHETYMKAIDPALHEEMVNPYSNTAVAGEGAAIPGEQNPDGIPPAESAVGSLPPAADASPAAPASDLWPAVTESTAPGAAEESPLPEEPKPPQEPPITPGASTP